MSTVAEHIALLRERANTLERIAKNTGNPWPNHADLQSDAAFMFNAILLVSVHLDELETLAREDFRRRPASSEAAPSAIGGEVPSEREQRLMDALEGECDGLAITRDVAQAILYYVDTGEAPNA